MNRIIVNGPEQGAGRPLGIAAPLLPIAQGSNSNIDLSGEFGLGQASSASDFFDLHRVDVELAGRLTFATHDLVHLGHAFDQFSEEFFVHGYLQFSTICRSIFF